MQVEKEAPHIWDKPEHYIKCKRELDFKTSFEFKQKAVLKPKTK